MKLALSLFYLVLTLVNVPAEASSIDNKKQICIHHDNFYREVSRPEKWKIGENYGSQLTYYSPRKDFETVDDGFRINTLTEETGDKSYPHKVISGYLTNDKNVSVEKSFRFITTSSHLKENFIIEVSVPSIEKYAEVVCNYFDDNHYDSFEITRTSFGSVNIVLKRISNGQERKTDLVNSQIIAKSIKIVQDAGQIALYLDEKPVGEILKSFIIDEKRPMGILVSRQHIYEYRVFDVYTIGELKHIEAGNMDNNGIPYEWYASFTKDYSYSFLPTLKVANIGGKLPRISRKYPSQSCFVNSANGKIYENEDGLWVETGKMIGDYAMYYNLNNNRIYICDGGKLIEQSKGKQSDFPNYIQRFELRATDVTDTKSAHCEICENNDSSINNFNIRNRSISFSTFLPVSFLEDDNKIGDEAFIQFQVSTDGGKTRIPLFTIASEVYCNNKVRYHLNRRYIPTRPVPKKAKWDENILGDNDVDLGRVKLGEWEQWEVLVKEGYMVEHNPLLIVKRNGAIVYQSFMPNTYNVKNGSYIRYGLYKSIYKKDNTPNRKRVIYISNFKCDI